MTIRVSPSDLAEEMSSESGDREKAAGSTSGGAEEGLPRETVGVCLPRTRKELNHRQ